MASTYVNDLRLEEIGSGEQSGTWGDTTNTNLELIAEAFSFGTEAITTNADTHTTTIADGATDPGRSMFLKYTGTLDSACTITIGPNTVSKLWFIENGTSGSQNIIISQGSGANVTIPAGQTKAVYSNGGGSGAAMVDAFATLNVVDLLVDDDLTVTDDMTVGGTLGVTGVVTANAGVVVDEMTLDADTLTATDTFTIDAVGDITLDADGGDILFKDGGVLIADFENASSDFKISSQVQDKDLILTGNDGGSFINALVLDMSTGGTAYFNDDVRLTDNHAIRLGTDGDIVFYHDGTNGHLESAGNFTLNVAGNIILDADGGDIKFTDGGTEFGRIYNSSSDLAIFSPINNQDIKIQGTDDSSVITALTLDMSDAGTATFNHDIKLSDNGRIIFGAGNDLAIYSNGTDGRIEAPNGDLVVDLAGELVIDADLQGEGNGVLFKDGGTTFGNIFRSESDLIIMSVASDEDLVFKGNDGGSTITALTLDMSAAGEATFNAAVKIKGTNVSHPGVASMVLGQDTSSMSQIRVYGTNDSTLGTLEVEATTSAGATSKTLVSMREDAADFNPSALNMDFRVRSDANDNAFLVDASAETICIGTSNGNTPGTNTAGVNFLCDGMIGNTRDGGTCVKINRAQDGDLVEFRSAAAIEGTIAISGSTTSYNGFSGLHESSGIATNTPVGTVVSTIDELDVYPSTQGSGNEQEPHPKAGQTRADHAKIKVSDTAGDACVYGVVGSFNEQDKVNVTSVGIGSVRVTGACSKGDLLESNGDGTAKVQSDDIVRSKTLGKVTISNSNTGVKLVSCVMYCG